MLTELKKMVLEKIGYRQACREIEEVTLFHGTMQDLERIRKYGWAYHMKKSFIDGPYRTGLNLRWYEFGWQDAANGLCRARLFHNHAYNMGWNNSVLALRKAALTAAQLEQQFVDMQKHYWNKIGSGNSEEYYTTTLKT